MADSQADAVPKSPIIMKVDAPSDEVENNDNEAIGHTICFPSPRPIASRFGNPFAPKPSSPAPSTASASSSVLRPSQLSQHVHTTSKPFSLTPGKLNPFMKASTTDDHDSDEKKVESTNGETPKFMPLLTSSKSPPVVGSASVSSATADSQKDKPPVATTNFVFGQNLQERVISDPLGTSSQNTTSTSNVSSTSDDCKPSSSTGICTSSAATNGTSSREEMLFSTAIKDAPVSTSDPGSASKSLTESAREYEEQRNNKRKYEEVETKTGEEDETNVMQISCKLFAFDKGVGNWQERGRGILRLNDLIVADKDNDEFYTQSRLVFRTSGVHKVILNTKIWAEMTVEQASAKSVRFTAIDTAGDIKVFLVMASPEETKHLHRLLQERRTAEQKRQHLKKQTTDETSPRKNDSTSSLNMDTSHEAEAPADDDDITNGRQATVIRTAPESSDN